MEGGRFTYHVVFGWAVVSVTWTVKPSMWLVFGYGVKGSRSAVVQFVQVGPLPSTARSRHELKRRAMTKTSKRD
jgi:hypothetical protein